MTQDQIIAAAQAYSHIDAHTLDKLYRSDERCGFAVSGDETKKRFVSSDG